MSRIKKYWYFLKQNLSDPVCIVTWLLGFIGLAAAIMIVVRLLG
jgi:hypothetical protein